MPQQLNRVSYPIQVSHRGKDGKLIHIYRQAWLTGIYTKRDQTRVFLKVNVPGMGEVIAWLPTAVTQEILKYLANKSGRRPRRLTPRERELLYGMSNKDRKLFIEQNPGADINKEIYHRLMKMPKEKSK